ncbi:hypothetical protein LDENG_00239040 [Lucifuga dentata]|nr:hypothetical protein LDENG_00239040 [Lucifuga dentata]
MSAPGHQMVNLPPVGRLILTRDESDEGGVIRKLQELDGLMTGGAAVGVQGEEQRRKDSETCLPSLTCCQLSDRKSVIHLQVESGSWESLSCSRAGMIVLNAELKSTNRILDRFPGSPGAGE